MAISSHFALEPEALAQALAARVADAAPGTREALVREDLASGRFLPGRGLLDMKAGLAAGLAAISVLARSGELSGNLLFLAVPDEENASAGARAAAATLPRLLADRGLHLKVVINLDAIADDGDGRAGRAIALGTVGKVLPTALVVGAPVHSGFPLRGINAAVLAAAIAARLEWAPELTDGTGSHAGTPVSLLSLKDGKSGYDVTTPATAFATWNVLNQTRDPGSVLPEMARLAREAVEQMMSVLAGRAGGIAQAEALVHRTPEVPILFYGDLLASLRATDPGIDDWQNAEAVRLARSGASLPEMCEALTLRLWRRSGRVGPAVILGLGSVPYLATTLEDAPVEAAVDAVIRHAIEDHGVMLAAIPYFPGISDMSFFGQSHVGGLSDVSVHTPGWDVLVGLERCGLAGVPTVNLGPWGRDYHTVYERIDVDYGFRVLPHLVAELVRRVLA
jgi:arginine utilization protein RocB